MNNRPLSVSLSKIAFQSTVAGILCLAIFAATFFMAEPQVSYGDQSVDFTVRQVVLDETSFLVPPANVTMTGPINGLTGGNATGTTQFVVRSNNPDGYNVEISFSDTDADGHAMRGDISGTGEIRNYSGEVGGVPSFGFTASSAAQFAYSVYSSSTADTVAAFKNNGSNACNSTTQTIGRCWKAPNISPFTIVTRGAPAPTGATSTIYFVVNVPSGATPAPTAQTYTATATLSVLAI